MYLSNCSTLQHFRLTGELILFGVKKKLGTDNAVGRFYCKPSLTQIDASEVSSFFGSAEFKIETNI